MAERLLRLVCFGVLMSGLSCSSGSKPGGEDLRGTPDLVDLGVMDAGGDAALDVLEDDEWTAEEPRIDTGEDIPLELPDLADAAPDIVEIAPDVPTLTEIKEVEVEVVLLCEPGQPCDDGDPCTDNDECLGTGDGAVCVGDPLDCEDGLECTFDLCTDGECNNDMKPGWCFVAGTCYIEGESNPTNPCMECITAYKIYTWSADDTNDCDDGNSCSEGDGCDNGVCQGAVVTCDDENPCTEDLCNFGDCVFLPLNNVACDDGDLCSLGDYCLGGECESGDKLRVCDDFNSCTDDSCDPATGCVFIPTENACEDGNLCTVNDYCTAGLCMPGEDAICEDGNECTDDSCSPFVGCKYVNNALPCDDNDPCTLGDKCTGGVCKKGPELNDCDDANSCTSEWCLPGQGCQYLAINAACNDLDACTFGDHCQDGECIFDFEKTCNDGNFCTDDECVGEFGCSNTFNSNPCDDDNACTIGDQCVEGACTPGMLEKECFDENPCATGYCDPEMGCIMTPLDGSPCNDGDLCTLGDECLAGACAPGDEILGCDDGNVCTADWCDPVLGCLHENIEALCDDLNLCTEGDSCTEGLCVGSWVNCDDDNQCTIDSCDPWQGCQYSVIVSAYCQPQIIIDSPLRAAQLTGPPFTINVTGHVIHNAAPIAWVTINDEEVQVVDDAFSFAYPAAQGLNIIEAEVFDQFDGHDKVVQTFLMSTGYTPMNDTNPAVSMIPDGVMVYLGCSVWDDDNPDPNDFATFFTYFLSGIDINSSLPSPLYENGQYEIKSNGVTYGTPSLDINCMAGGLQLVATIPNIHTKIKADSKKWYLPDASGDIDVDSMVVSMDAYLSVDGAGNVSAVIQNMSSDVNGLDIDLDGVLGFLLNWLVDFFEGTFAGMLEDQIEDAMKDSIPPAIESALQDLAFDTEFEVPPMIGDGDPVTLSMTSSVSTLEFTPQGGIIGLKAAVVAPKGVDLPSPGSIHRGGCLTDEGPFQFWMMNEIEMGLFDNFLNQIPYAMWWAGLLTIPLDAGTLGGGSFEEYGIEDMEMVATALLPPVITDCPSGDEVLMQMGDMEIAAAMSMWGMPVEVTMYVAFEAEIEIGVTSDGPLTQLEMGVTDVKSVKLELATVSENLVGSEDGLRLLVKQHVLPVFLEQITGDSLASIPLPSIDVGAMVPDVPEGTTLDMTPKTTYRDKGYTTISGTVHE